MRRHLQSSSSTTSAVRSATSSAHWLVVAVSLCGALAGASIIEALAALASRSSAPISPDHLIAAPLALAGAICGGLLAAVLVSKEHQSTSNSPDTVSHAPLVADSAPSEPLVWQPATLVIPGSRLAATSSPRISHMAPQARRLRRALRHRSAMRHTAYTVLSHQTPPR